MTVDEQLDEMKAGKLLLAKALGVTDEPRWKWIILEVENMKAQLDAIHRQQEPVVKVMWCNGIIASSISPSMNLYGYEPLYLHPSADTLDAGRWRFAVNTKDLHKFLCLHNITKDTYLDIPAIDTAIAQSKETGEDHE